MPHWRRQQGGARLQPAVKGRCCLWLSPPLSLGNYMNQKRRHNSSGLPGKQPPGLPSSTVLSDRLPCTPDPIMAHLHPLPSLMCGCVVTPLPPCPIKTKAALLYEFNSRATACCACTCMGRHCIGAAGSVKARPVDKAVQPCRCRAFVQLMRCRVLHCCSSGWPCSFRKRYHRNARDDASSLLPAQLGQHTPAHVCTGGGRQLRHWPVQEVRKLVCQHTMADSTWPVLVCRPPARNTVHARC